MSEQIDRKLNLVLTYPRENGAPIYVHSVAVSRQIFETFYLVISRAFASIQVVSGGIAAGPRIAALELKRAATQLEVDANGLLAEMQRLSSVVHFTEKGWETLPYHEAVKKGHLDDDEASEVENALAFFTVASRMFRKQDVKGVLGMMTNLWGARIVSSNSTVFKDSLPMWMPDVSTGEKATA